MAGDRVVKVVFVGDASSLKRATDSVGASLSKVQSQVNASSSGLSGVFSKLGASAKNATDGVSGHFSNMASNVGRSMVTFGKVVGAGVLAGVAGLAVFGKNAVSAASGLAESVGKSNVVFGEQAAEIERWAGTASRAFGQSKQQALEAAGTYGNLFQAFGVGRTESAKMSKSLVELAADLASFNNTDVNDALEALRSGLSGETEPLKRFGVALSDERLKLEAVRLGLIKNTKEGLTPAAKAQASYALIMKDTALAQGDFARTSDGLANRTRILKARFADIQAEIGTKLLPVMVSVAGFVLDKVLPAFETLSRRLEPVFRAVGGFISQFARSFAASDFPATSNKWSNAAIRMAEVFRKVFDTVRGGVRAFVDAFRSGSRDIESSGFAGFMSRIGAVSRSVFGWLRDNVPKILSAIGTFISEQVVPRLQRFGNYLKNDLGPAIAVAFDSFKKDIWPTIEQKVLPALQKLGKFIVDELVPALGKVATIIAEQVLPNFFQAWKFIFEDLIPTIANFITAVYDIAKAFFKVASDIVTAVAGIVVTGWDLVVRIKEVVADVIGAFVDIGKKIAAPFIAGFNLIADAWNATIGSLPSFSIGIPGLGTVTTPKPPTMKKFDTGGIVDGPLGQAQLAIVHAGETILPTHKMGLDAALAKVTQQRVPQFANGGVVGPVLAARGGGGGSSRTVVVNINAPVYGVNDLKRTIKEAVQQGSKADGGWAITLRNAS